MPVQTNIKVSTISYVILYVKDTEKALPFYRDVLGAKVKVSHPGWVEFDLGHVTLALHGDEGKTPEGRGAVVPVFPVENLDEAYKALKSANVKITMEPKQVCETPTGYGWSVDFADPDGNVLSFYSEKKK